MSDGGEVQLGPVEWLVVEFPPGCKRFDAEIAAELASLVDTELIRIVDLLIIDKGPGGVIDVVEFEDLGDIQPLRVLDGRLAEVLALEDIERVSEAMTPNSTAGLVVWENTWAAPMGEAARRSGAQIIAAGQVPADVFVAALLVESPEG